MPGIYAEWIYNLTGHTFDLSFSPKTFFGLAELIPLASKARRGKLNHGDFKITMI